jgi:class 3 adenylate cyclase
VGDILEIGEFTVTP